MTILYSEEIAEVFVRSFFFNEPIPKHLRAQGIGSGVVDYRVTMDYPF